MIFCMSSTFRLARPRVPSYCKRKSQLCRSPISNSLLTAIPLFLGDPVKLDNFAGASYSLLSELSGTLILGVPQQFNDAALIWGKSRDLLDNFTDESGAAGEGSLGSGDTGASLDDGGFL